MRWFLRYVVALSALFILTTSMQAQERAGRADTIRFEIHFRWDDSRLDTLYMGNNRTFELLEKQIQSLDAEQIDSIIILSQSSPEGNHYYNQRLSERRAASMRRWMQAHHPELQERLTVNPDGESWEQLSHLIQSDGKLSRSSIDRLVGLIENPTLTIESRKQGISDDPVYRYLYRTYYPQIRNSRISILYRHPAKQQPLSCPLELTTHKTPPAAVELTPPVVEAPAPELYFRRDTLTIAAKSNLLYDALTALNVELELPIRNHWSVAVEYAFPWWESGNKHCLQMLEAGIEGRYWFRRNPWHSEKLRGHFVGLYGMSAKYDLQWDRDLGYQGEGWSVGLTYGYSLKLTRHLNMEFSISVGYLSTAYRHYFPADDYSVLWRDKKKQGRMNYFGPTKLKVSLVWPIHIPYKTKGGTR